MADVGMIACAFRDVGCLFTCGSEDAMSKHYVNGSLQHQLSMMATIKRLTDENNSLMRWKCLQEAKQTEDSSSYLSQEVQTVRHAHNDMDTRICALNHKLNTHIEHVTNLEKDATSQLAQLTTTTSAFNDGLQRVQNKLGAMETEQILHGDRIAHAKSALVDVENKVRTLENAEDIHKGQFDQLKEELLQEQEKLSKTCSELQASIQQIMEQSDKLASEDGEKSEDLEEEPEGVVAQDGYYEWVVEDFTQLLGMMRSDEVFYSPKFYTHSGGYSMCLCLKKHKEWIKFGACLLRGKNDGHLKWPYALPFSLDLWSVKQATWSISQTQVPVAFSKRSETDRKVHCHGLREFDSSSFGEYWLKNDKLRCRIQINL